MKFAKIAGFFERRYKIKRKEWPIELALEIKGLRVVNWNGDAPFLSWEDIVADDWEVLPKKEQKKSKEENDDVKPDASGGY